MASIRILVVDDDPGIRKGCRNALEQHGYAVQTAAHGLEALQRLEGERFHLVLTDLEMPEMNGLELLRELRRRQPDLPVLLFTAFSTVESSGQALSLGAAGCLAKPFELDELYAAVERALKGPGLPQQRASAVLSSEAALGSFLNFLLELTAKTVHVDACHFLVLSEDGTQLVVRASRGGLRRTRLGDALPLSTVASASGIVIDGPVLGDPRFKGIERFLAPVGDCFPACEGRRLVGLLVAGRETGAEFTGEERSLLELYARYAAVLIGHAGAYRELQRTYGKLEEAQSQLVQQAKLSVVGQLVSGLVHDINNPLTSILTNAGHLRQIAPEGPVRETAEIVEKGALALKAIVTGLMGFVRRDPTPAGGCDPAAVARESVALIHYQCRLNRIRATIESEPGPHNVWIDGPQLQQVLLNLLMNAIHAIRRDGAIELRIEPVPAERSALGRAEVRLSVADTGPGIAPHLLQRIFDPFFTTKKQGEGTGLGLARCREIVESHGGKIWAENREGGGARFWVHLPAARAAASQALPAPAAPEASEEGRKERSSP